LAPFGTFWHLLALIWAWEKKVPGIGKAGNGLRTFENVFAG